MFSLQLQRYLLTKISDSFHFLRDKYSHPLFILLEKDQKVKNISGFNHIYNISCIDDKSIGVEG